MAAISFDAISATVVDPPAAPRPPIPAPPAAARGDDRRRLDDLLRQRSERLARLAAD